MGKDTFDKHDFGDKNLLNTVKPTPETKGMISTTSPQTDLTDTLFNDLSLM